VSRTTLRTIILVVCSVLFVLVGIGVERNAWTARDAAVAHWFEAHITPARTVCAFAITQIGSDFFIFPVTLVIALRLRRISRYWLERALITIVGGTISNEALKFVFYRQRPHFSHPLLHLQSNSFPSGHTLAATVLFGTLILLTFAFSKSRVLRIAVIPGGVVAILQIAASRIYLGVHYFSDVIGGLLEGFAWLSGVGIFMDRKGARRADLQRFRIAG
jgi:undecaprenyl-diphosphatase